MVSSFVSNFFSLLFVKRFSKANETDLPYTECSCCNFYRKRTFSPLFPLVLNFPFTKQLYLMILDTIWMCIFFLYYISIKLCMISQKCFLICRIYAYRSRFYTFSIDYFYIFYKFSSPQLYFSHGIKKKYFYFSMPSHSSKYFYSQIHKAHTFYEKFNICFLLHCI